MIEINQQQQLTGNGAEHVPIKVVGLGGAGLNVIDRIVLDGAVPGTDLVVMNTDVQSLTSSVASQKVQLGRGVTHGLGAGGDPELGLGAAEEAQEDIRQALDGASLIFLCAGLGGGTGSGAAPLVASIAKENGALVVVIATMPFSFEGKRRARQAEEALTALQGTADAVICFENDIMGDAVAPKAGIHQAFASADETISQCVRAVTGIFTQPGILHIGFDDLCSALRPADDGSGRCLFGFGEATGDNRANEALTRALRNPLMDRGRMLDEAHNVLVNVAGGPDMTLNEVQLLMEEFAKNTGEETQILFGASVDQSLNGRISVTILSSTGMDLAGGGNAHEFVQQAAPKAVPQAVRQPAPVAPPTPAAPKRTPAPAAKEKPQPLPAEEEELVSVPVDGVPEASAAAAAAEPEAAVTGEIEQAVQAAQTADATADDEAKTQQASLLDLAPLAADPEPQAAAPQPRPVPPRAPRVQRQPRILATAADPQAVPPAPSRREERQETLQFEPVTRGRFEKSEPTIVDGQDLDVPTFLRRNMKVP